MEGRGEGVMTSLEDGHPLRSSTLNTSTRMFTQRHKSWKCRSAKINTHQQNTNPMGGGGIKGGFR